MAIVVQDELIFKVPRPWWRSEWLCNPGVATFLSVEVVFGSEEGLTIGPAFGTKSVAAKAICSMLIVLAVVGLGVERNDGDLAPAIEVVAVVWEGEDSNLIFSLGL
jgi:hypothetical protein